MSNTPGFRLSAAVLFSAAESLEIRQSLSFFKREADMFMKNALIIAAAIMIAASGSVSAEVEIPSEDVVDELFALSFEDLLDVKVITASKRSQKVSEAPSPVYVFTAEDIQRTGVRNIQELLKFIPGWYVYPRIDQPFVIANRGIRSSSNDKTLFLIDGIPLNNISKSGAVNADKFPGLDKVKRVEVISGPGSTMWGSDASLGIIHIITKDGKDIDGNIINVNVATEDNPVEVNFLSGKEFLGGEYMFSFTYAQSDGFGDERNGFKNYVHDFGTVPWNDQQGNFNHLYPSYEIYGKITIQDFTIKALASEKSMYTFWTTSASTDYFDKQDAESVITSKDIHLELSHHADLADNKTLETKVTAKQISYIRDQLVEIGTDHGPKFDDPDVEPIDHTAKFPENGVGLELIFNWDINEKNKLLAGTRIRVVNAGPAEINYVNLNTGQTPDDDVVRDSVYYHETTDTTYGAYVEDTYYATDKLILIGGVRIDYNDPRETTSVIMPRGAAIYNFSDTLSLKYMYNTGYVRPLMGKSFEVALAKEGSVKESEKIRAHDVALIYNTDKTQLIVDVFHMTTYDRNRYDAIAAAHVDSGDIYTQGFETSFKRILIDRKLIFDLNYGYATAEEEDESGNESTYYEGIPNHVYAAGVDYKFTNKISLYTTVYGWADLKMDNVEATGWIDSPEHSDYSGDYLVDMNLRVKDLFVDSLNLSLYVLNVFDEEARLQAKDDWHAWWTYA